VTATRDQAGRRGPPHGPPSRLSRLVPLPLRYGSGAATQPVYQITSARRGVRDDVDSRARRYLFSMGVRMAFFLGAVVADGWLRWVMIVPALVLPYLSVVFANGGREPIHEEAALFHDQDVRAAPTGTSRTQDEGKSGREIVVGAGHADCCTAARTSESVQPPRGAFVRGQASSAH
jgi:Protein of unknown function (DUF3099)